MVYLTQTFFKFEEKSLSRWWLTYPFHKKSVKYLKPPAIDYILALAKPVTVDVFQSQGWEAAKNTDLHVDSVCQVSRAAWTACWYLSWASWAIRKWKKVKFKKKNQKKKNNQVIQSGLFLNFLCGGRFYLWSGHFNIPKKNTPRIARNIGSISIIFSFSGSMFFMVFLFDISRLRLLAIDQWVVCTHILKEPWNPFKKIANRQYHIHIIQHLWYLRNKKKVRFMLNNLLQRLQTWQPNLGQFWKDSLHFRLKKNA